MGAENSTFARTPSENRLYGGEDHSTAAQQRPGDVEPINPSLESFVHVAQSLIEARNKKVAFEYNRHILFEYLIFVISI